MRARSLLTLVLVATIALFARAESNQPAGWDGGIKLREAVDINPDPLVVEVNIEARVARVTYEPGKQVDAWTYNGDIPGPLIRIRAGNRLIVHFTNNLPKPTTMHWHGLRIPIQMDGVPGHSQPEVQPGESFTYDFTPPDAGLFWYHPHVMSAMQVGYGLYGALLVEDPAEKVDVSDELVLVLSDIAIDDNGGLQAPENAGPVAMAFGLEGNHVLVNGRTRPRLMARPGVPQRWRIVNAAKSKYFELQLGEISGAPFTRIGGDGGIQEYPIKEETLVIAPGERVDAIVAPNGAAGEEIVVRSLPYNRGYGSEYLSIEELFTIALVGLPSNSPQSNVTIHRDIAPIDQKGATRVTMDITLVQPDDRTIEYRINNTSMAKLRPFPATVGEIQIWTITNQTKWSHPVHLHGFFFQVLDKDGQPARPLAWKDTVDVPFNETVSFIVRFDERPGMWMIHCHVLDHAEGGLMTMVELVDSSHDSHHE